MERRKEDLKLLIEFKEFVADNKQWRISTDEYRKSLCVKLNTLDLKVDDMNMRIYQLPCKTRAGLYDSLDIRIKWIWGILVGIILAIIGTFWRRQ